MKNDIEPWIGFDGSGVNISEIDKYDKFVSFKKDEQNLFQFDNPLFMFYTDEMTCEDYKEEDGFLSAERMKEALEKRIENELKQDYELQNKIKEIQRKAKERIEKLQSKPKKKLQDKYNYKYFEEYFNKGVLK